MEAGGCSSSIKRRLEGKVAIITGGANGIGEATARLFVENGAIVVIADIQEDKGAELVNDLGLHVASYRHCNVALESDVEELVAFTLGTWGKLDVMFNNAGISGNLRASDVRDMDVVDFDSVMSVNVRGMALGVKHAAKAMVDAKIAGSIICTASVSSLLACPGSPLAYTVSKHAVVGLVRAAASDLGKYGIRVNGVSPSALPTQPFLNYLREALNASPSIQEVQALLDSANHLSHHSFTPLDVAKAVLYLASNDAAFVSGTNLVVDGGYSSCKKLFDKDVFDVFT